METKEQGLMDDIDFEQEFAKLKEWLICHREITANGDSVVQLNRLISRDKWEITGEIGFGVEIPVSINHLSLFKELGLLYFYQHEDEIVINVPIRWFDRLS